MPTTLYHRVYISIRFKLEPILMPNRMNVKCEIAIFSEYLV